MSEQTCDHEWHGHTKLSVPLEKFRICVKCNLAEKEVLVGPDRFRATAPIHEELKSMSQPCTHNGIGSIVASRENDDLYGTCLDCGARVTGSAYDAFHPRPVLAWTTEPPTQQAVYWYKENDIPYLALTTVVFCYGGGSYVQVTLMQIPWGLVPMRISRVDELPGQWAGPLEVPE